LERDVTRKESMTPRDEAERLGRKLNLFREDMQREAAGAAAAREKSTSLTRQVRELEATAESNEVYVPRGANPDGVG
jgi:hypothetical protein